MEAGVATGVAGVEEELDTPPTELPPPLELPFSEPPLLELSPPLELLPLLLPDPPELPLLLLLVV